MYHKELLIKYRRGDKLTDDELVDLKYRMEQIELLTRYFGDIFALVNIYARRVHDNLTYFYRNREKKD